LGYIADAATMRRNLCAIRAEGLGEVFVATDTTGVVIGWLNVRTSWVLEYGHFAEVLGLVVDGERRSGGVGASLLATAETWAQQRGLVEMRVRSNVVRERAHAFYRRAGYLETKRQIQFRKALK
jgi:GNAT superfamily N-acetyltransferase